MISGVKVSDPSRASVHWWSQVPWLQGRTSIDFKPGLNIIWGPNGSGKSTVLLAMAKMLQCATSRSQAVTEGSVRDLIDGSFHLRDGVVPVHDGAPVMFLDPSKPVGLTHGMIDWDHGFQGLSSLLGQRTSQGEQTVVGLGEVLEAVRSGLPPVRWGMAEDRVNDLWAPVLRRIREMLAGDPDAPKGPPTILLDEPDRSLGVLAQHDFWLSMATKFSRRVQIIATSHSPFALMLPDTNYIETVPGNLAECEAAVRSLAGRSRA